MNAPVVNGPWSIRFDHLGRPDPDLERNLVKHIEASEITDLVLFSHGWNNDEQTAASLYDRWYALLREQLASVASVGFVGLRWPSQLWRDEPIPTFPAPPRSGNDWSASGTQRAFVAAGSPSLPSGELDDLKNMFPDAREHLDTIAELLDAGPGQVSTKELLAALKAFGATDGEGFNDGEAIDAAEPAMLDTANQDELFDLFALILSQSGVGFDDDVGDGSAGEQARAVAERRKHGAKEALRQLSYWKMKKRAGVIGKIGLGPLISKLSTQFSSLRFHLVGHSFGARVVSFAVEGVPDGPQQNKPIKSVTLLQGAFSRYAFAEDLPFFTPFGPKRGALSGTPTRIDGPLTVCFSEHDRALSTFYPLASMSAGDYAAGSIDLLRRWRAIGHLGAYQDPDKESETLGPVEHTYTFTAGAILNVDASNTVADGDSRSGAHSDIFHPELAWLMASAARLNRPAQGRATPEEPAARARTEGK